MNQLLLYSCIFFSLSIGAQSARIPHDFSAENWRLHTTENAAHVYPAEHSAPVRPSTSKPSPIGLWQPLCGSMNVYGMLFSSQHALQYNSKLNAISFIHRQSDSYSATPNVPITAASGVIVAEISTNGGASFDSTCIWANATEWGRYPQGGIYNPIGNTNIANAQVIGCGVTVNTSGFSGTWYASKSLASYNSTASTLPNAQQAFSFLQGPYSTAMPRHGWMTQSFCITDDGLMHAVGVLGDDLSNTTSLRGYAVLTGSMNGQTVDWSIESVIPNAERKSDSTGLQISEAKMAWNNAGTVGYLVGVGTLKNALLSNRSFQPIIYKLDRTLSASASWTLMPALDFNTTFTAVASHLPKHDVTWPTVTGSAVPLPFVSEFDITVDSLNRLHLAAIFMSGFSDHPDSLQFYSTFANVFNTTESYRWQHVPGDRPYVYDFVSKANNSFDVFLIDSLSSESPGISIGDAGYNENPWDADVDGTKISIDARLQLSRTRDGRFIFFSWAESDTLFTNNQFKYNNLPELKLRAIQIKEGCSVFQSFSERNISFDNDVRTRATLHYASPIASSNYTIAGLYSPIYTVTVKCPFTITNSNPYSQLTNNVTWFSNAAYTFQFGNGGSADPFACVGIAEEQNLTATFELIPNPATEKVRLVSERSFNSDLKIQVCNISGQVILQTTASALQNGQELNIYGISAGIYFVSINEGGMVLTKKLVIE
jgi:hypothetical protein